MPPGTPVPRRNSLTRAEFVREFMLPNLPVLIGPSATSEWRARREWVDPATGRPNLDFLRSAFGQAAVDVADCGERWFSDQRKSRMPFAEFVDQWKEEIGRRERGEAPEWVGYCKDWHLARDFPEYKAYTLFDGFRDDWLNAWYDARGDDDYRFVYMGCKGTWTPFHADVLKSYSWSSNVCGRKRWVLFYPGQEDLFTDKFGDLVYLSSQADPERFPHFDKAVRIECVQEPGETLYVPSGWYHEVYNLEDTISINHNWINAFNIDFAAHALLAELGRIEASIDHLREGMTAAEWDDQCQLMLRSLAGLDFAGFRDWMKFVASQLAAAVQPLDAAAAVETCTPAMDAATLDVAIAAMSGARIQEALALLNQFPWLNSGAVGHDPAHAD
ncbi:hypothetical protein H9P43_001280 [Blastocladiella emersonii ATCC 22665]|nr:hypothetical protein H9P43_001280 [Blastocladiella emersonii ATCC 22665]